VGVDENAYDNPNSYYILKENEKLVMGVDIVIFSKNYTYNI